MSQLFTRAFWRKTAGALLRSALAALTPFVFALVQDPTSVWRQALLTIGLAAVGAIAMALVGLPDPTSLSWWELASTRALRQFGQMVLAGASTAVLLTDVPWSTVLPHAAAAALTTMILAAISALPAPVEAGTSADGAAIITSLLDPEASSAGTAVHLPGVIRPYGTASVTGGQVPPAVGD